MTLRRRWALALLWSCATACQAAVTVSGEVRDTQPISWQPGMRLLDVMTAAQPDAQGYWLAAAWLHQPLLERQARLKAGVLFDLDTLRRAALAAGRESRARAAAQLYRQVLALSVTGRQIAKLDPVAVEVGFAPNLPVSEGDRLIYPSRPDTVRVFGAVVASPALAEADADQVWLIQPDGHVTRLGVAPWNRADGLPLAPGSTLLVPIRSDDLDPPTPELNPQLAEFIGTQPLAEVSP